MNISVLKHSILPLLLVLLLATSGCALKDRFFGDSETKEAYGELATAYLAELSEKGPRLAGTQGEADAANWIKDQLVESGYEVTRQEFLFKSGEEIFESENIIAEKAGESEQTILVGAHYDSVDAGGDGVDDNGSGVALALETAARLKDVETPQTIRFVFFGAEEFGSCGSNYYVSHADSSELSNLLLMINFDSIVAGDFAYVYGDAGANGKFRDRVLELADENDLTLRTQAGENPAYPAGTTCDFSDHGPFKNAGIPHVYFEATNWFLGEQDGYTQVNMNFGVNGEIWHTSYDTISYLNETFPGRIEAYLSLFSNLTDLFLLEDLSKL